jgi:hypothetical protein
MLPSDQDPSGWAKLAGWVSLAPTLRFMNTGAVLKTARPFIEARSRKHEDEPYVYGEGTTILEAANELARKLKIP